MAETYLYVNGNLCYIAEWSLRILDLHNSSRVEDVVDILTLLDAAIEPPVNTEKDEFKLLHYSHGVVSCLYSRRKNQEFSWLIVFNPSERRILTAYPLESTNKIFVRNNDEYLYFGTHSEYGDDGFRRWVLQGYCFSDEKWFDQKVHLLEMVGSDIGGSIAFEIIDGYFYGISNQTSFEVEEINWTSYYHCFRFPVDQPRPKKTEVSVKEMMWRRQHAEGPIDDRWSFIKLEKEEKSGSLRIIESRKEWIKGQSSATRTYYTTNVIFPATGAINLGRGSNGEGSSANRSTIGNAKPDQFLIPTKEETPRRNPFNTHQGDDAASDVMFILTKCHIRSYHSTCQTFIDLVDDPLPTNPQDQRLRIRAGSRRARPLEELTPEARRYGHNPQEDDPSTEEQIKALYRNDGDNSIAYWPPEQEEGQLTDPAYDELNRLLNPPTHLGNVHGTCDDRSMVYATGGAVDGMQVLVFVSFDPSIHLQGLRQWRDQLTPRARFPHHRREHLEKAKGKGKLTCQPPLDTCLETEPETREDWALEIGPTPDETLEGCGLRWTQQEPALYLTLAWGFNFAL